jgi:hypothetical protein
MRPPGGQAMQLVSDTLYRPGDDAVVYPAHFKEIIKEHLAELLMV